MVLFSKNFYFPLNQQKQHNKACKIGISMQISAEINWPLAAAPLDITLGPCRRFSPAGY